MKQRSRSPLVYALALSLVIATCGMSFYLLFRAMSRDLRQTATDFAESVKSTLNFTPRIIVDKVTILQESTPVLQLVAVKHQFHHQMRWTNTWLGSTKEIELNGEFTASVGFDLKQEFSATFDSKARIVHIRLPHAQILSVQLDHIQTSQDAGWWNSITDADRDIVLNSFTTDARSAVEKSSTVLNKAQYDLEQQLSTLLGSSGLKVEFETLSFHSSAR